MRRASSNRFHFLLCAALILIAGESAPAQDRSSEESSRLIDSVRAALSARLRYPDLPYRTSSSSPSTVDEEAKSLTLDEVLNLVELYHPKLRGAEISRQIAAGKRLEKQGAFDPVIFTDFDYLRFNSEFDPKSLRGKPATSRLLDGGVEFLTRSGVKIAAGTRYNFGKIKAPYSPTGNGGEYFVELKVPLLRGRGINEKSAAERQATLGEPLANTEYELTRLDLLYKAAESYWDWVAARRRLDVTRDMLGLAQFRAAAVKDRVVAGDLPPIDGVEADLELRRREAGVAKADRDLQKAAFKLSLFLWAPNGLPAPIPGPSSAPTLTPPPVAYGNEISESGRRMALDRRPELKALAINGEITRVDLDLARNQRRPALDLAFSPGRDTGYGAIGNTLKAGIGFSLPLRQRTAEGRITQANLKLQKIELDLAVERQRITTQVLDTISAIENAVARHRAAQAEVDLAIQMEEGERTRFNLGDSTLFLVNQRERATAEARIKLIEIEAEYQQAVAAYRAATVQL